MRKVIFNLLKKYPVQNIENAFIQAFFEQNNLTIKKNLLLLDICNDDSPLTRTIKSKISYPKNIYELEKIFELLINPEDRKLNGAFYTPKLITEYVTSELIENDNQLICDPACGCGAFLIAATEQLCQKGNKPINKIIEENIFGADIQKDSLRRCKILLSLLALLHNNETEKLNFNLYEINSLSKNIYKVFKPIIDKGGFDLVIGNPPYVKYQDLSENMRNDLVSNWQTIKTGNFNLYFAFFELGINLLKTNGRLGFIVPNNYFTSIAGINLRNYLQSNQYLTKIIDFTHLKIFEAQTYTCITFLQKNKNRNFKYEKITNDAQLCSLDKLNFSTNSYDDLNIKKWRLLKSSDADNIKIIEKMPCKVKDIVDIRVGIATCKDNVYFIDENYQEKDFYLKEYKNNIFKIEKSITKKITKISDFVNTNDFLKNTRRIIFPYNLDYKNANIISEKNLKKFYPQCYKYFLAVKKELLNRDKGNVEYPVWYSYARTQGLNFEGEKLLTPTFSNSPRFIMDKDPKSLFCNGYALFIKNTNQENLFRKNLNLSILKKILNSTIMDYYIRNTSVSIDGGYFCYQKNFIESFGIPELTNEDITFLEKNDDKDKIDEFLFQKYNLNPYNINTITKSTLINT